MQGRVQRLCAPHRPLRQASARSPVLPSHASAAMPMAGSIPIREGELLRHRIRLYSADRRGWVRGWVERWVIAPAALADRRRLSRPPPLAVLTVLGLNSISASNPAPDPPCSSTTARLPP
eukprot:7221288-Prymnesium_polylepis.1